MVSRRTFLSLCAMAPAGLLAQEKPPETGKTQSILARIPALCAELEKENGGRVGVFVLDTDTGEAAGYRGRERFPMCSTFKFLLAAAVLHGVDEGKLTLARELPIPARPLLGNSPLTEPHAGGSMTLADLCHAALTRSDNTAANLLLDLIGGPPGITAFARSLGDNWTRLDRNEPALNTSLDNDPRDTTTPAAMVGDLKTVLLGKTLKDPSRNQLLEWMQGNLTGLDRLRKDMPDGWTAADKTGSNGEHTSNDIAVLWPTGRAPVIVAAYITQCPGPEAKRQKMLAEIGRFVRESVLLGKRITRRRPHSFMF